MSTVATDSPADERDARIEELEGRLAALEAVREAAERFVYYNNPNMERAARTALVEALQVRLAALEAALNKERERSEQLDRLGQIVGGHYHDEQRRHRQTREILAAQFGVEVDTEAYEAAFEEAAKALRAVPPDGKQP